MLKENSVLRAEARQALAGKWPMAAVAALIYSAIMGGISSIPIIGCFASLLLLPIAYGLVICMWKVFKGGDVDLGTLFEGFNEYGRIMGTKLLVALYTVLWMLLLFVPGIIKGCSYAMTDFILKENPELSFDAAIEKSMAMMEGNKMKFFMLGLSFIGWGLLSILTFGIGYLFLLPYMQASLSAFYEDLKAQQVIAEPVVAAEAE